MCCHVCLWSGGVLLVLGRKKGREVGREDGKRAERKDRMKGKTGPGGVVRRGKKADKSATPTIALKLQVHDSLFPDMREHVYHLRINGSCNERVTPSNFGHHISFNNGGNSTAHFYHLPQFSVPVARGG